MITRQYSLARAEARTGLALLKALLPPLESTAAQGVTMKSPTKLLAEYYWTDRRHCQQTPVVLALS
jgi:hypothetical protein